ncbi:YciI family protein [Paraburkholderia sp.]|uniref:YciI family protein n=1 Tax=Paraburkholderia sp. TaxID=1926495 RepID=UPI0025FB9E31|nr:YciI family protein [Paraburkholderia sp.]
MYIVELSYLKPLDAIEVQLEAHRSFLDAQYANEVFLASGPKNPRNGGVILVSGRIARAELDAILACDPFHQHGLAAYHVTEFAPVKFHPTLKGIL